MTGWMHRQEMEMMLGRERRRNLRLLFKRDSFLSQYHSLELVVIGGSWEFEECWQARLRWILHGHAQQVRVSVIAGATPDATAHFQDQLKRLLLGTYQHWQYLCLVPER